MDDPSTMPDLAEIGRRAAARQVAPEHLPAAFDQPGRRPERRAERKAHAEHQPGAALQGRAVQRPHDRRAGRAKPRFPPDQEPAAAGAIARALDDLGVGPTVLAICGGACGGDLLFAEAALARGARLELYIPFDEPRFLEMSVDFADRDWRARYFAVRAAAVLHVAPNELGPIPDGEDAYERNNRWMLDAALRFGADKVDFLCLWNGEGGDGPGGARDMMNAVRARGGRRLWLDTTKLWS